jgi:citronellol/citronellal dehydrogenase
MSQSILADKVALVTGASRGVGAALCGLLASEGVHVACAARSTLDSPHRRLPGSLDAVVSHAKFAGVRALAVPTDLSRPDDVEQMVARTVEYFGRLDMLVNNAGMTLFTTLETPARRFDSVLAVNLTAPYLAMRAAVPAMRAHGGGRIINVSSSAALNLYPGGMAYGAAKIALERMTVDVAEQHRADHIAANCFRIDVAVASEGFMANVPDSTYDTWEPPVIAAEGIAWMLRQPITYTGRLESLTQLRERENVMVSRARIPYGTPGGLITSWQVGVPDIAAQMEGSA